MATKQVKTFASPELQEAAEQAATAPQSQAEAPDMGKARQTAPVAPRVTTGTSPGVIMRIRNHLAAALYSKEAQALEAGIQNIEGISTIKAHPQVGVYKAEVLDYLRGKIAARAQ